MVAENIVNLPSNKDSGVRPYTLMLVVHTAETPMLPGYAVSVTNNWLNQPNVEASINAFVGPDCTVRAVNTFNAAWHATWANTLSVGYETTAYAANTAADWNSTNGQLILERLAMEMAQDAKIFDIPLRWLTDAEVNAIRNGNRTIKGLATHRQIDPVNRTDPGTQFPYSDLLRRIKIHSGVAPAPAPTPPKEGPEVKYKRLYPKAVTRKLGKNAEWILKAQGADSKFAFNENYACLGVGLYDVDLFVQGTGLPTGETVTVQFYLETNGKRSGYFQQEIHGSADGLYKGHARFKMPVSSSLIVAGVTSSCDTASLSLYGAEITLAVV